MVTAKKKTAKVATSATDDSKQSAPKQAKRASSTCKTASSKAPTAARSEFQLSSDAVVIESSALKNKQISLAKDSLVVTPQLAASKNNYQLANSGISIPNNLFQPALNTAPPQNPQTTPLISPDVGPDPRNGVCSVTFDKVPSQIGANGIRFDFAYGYRILFPPGVQKKYQVSIYDIDSGMLIEQREQRGGDFIAGERKYFIRYRIEIRSEGKLIFEHNYDCTGKRVYIIVPDGGLGDNLAWLPYADLFQRHHRADVCCMIGEWMIRLVGDLYPGLNFMPSGGNPKLNDSYANYFCGIFSKDKKSWRPIDHQFLGMQAAVASVLGLPHDPLKCRLHRGSKRPFPEPFVCISTMATNPGKYWNFPDGWNILIRFLKSYGYRVLDIDRDPRLYFAGNEYTIPSESEDFTGRLPLQERINLLEHADFFIGLPSGLSWLAWCVDAPVVMLSGFTMPNCEFPTPYRVTNYLFCHGCWNDSNEFFDQLVPVWCPRHVGTPREIECTKAITPKMVQDVIMKIPAFQRQFSKVTRGEHNV